MRIIYFLFCYFVSAAFCFSQSEDSNSLKSFIDGLSSQKEDTIKVQTFDTICKKYLKEDLTKVNFYNNKLLKLSIALKYLKGYGLYYYYLSKTYQRALDLNKSIFFAKKALKIFYEIKDWDNYFLACNTIAHSMQINEDVDESIQFLLENIKIAKKKRKFKAIGKMLNKLSIICLEWNRPKECLIYSNLAIKYPCSIKTKTYIYRTIADVNIAFNDFEEATKYNNLALLHANTILGGNYIYIQKIKILHEQRRHKEALEIILKRKQLNKKLTIDEKNLNTLYLSKCYFYIKKYELALRTIKSILKETLLTDNDYFKVELLTHQSNIYLASKNTLQAKLNIDKAIDLFDPKYHFELELNLYTTKYMVEQAFNNYQEAFIYRNKAAEFQTKDNLRMNQEKLSYLQASFEINDKNYKIKKLETAQLLKAIEVKKQKNYILLSSIALVFSFLLTLFFIRTNKIIKLKNSIIEIEKLRTQKSLQEKEILLKEIHHRVKNNMQTVISLLKIQSLDAKELSVEDFISVSETRINSMIMVHENLYQNHDLSKVDFKEYLNNLTTSIKSAYQGFKKIEIQIDISNIYFDVQTAIPIGLIVNELVNNAYKHAFKNKEKGIILIQITQKDDQYQLMVSDDGLGITNHQINHNGLGLELVRLLVSQIKGSLEMDNSNGTSFKIKFKNVIV